MLWITPRRRALLPDTRYRLLVLAGAAVCVALVLGGGRELLERLRSGAEDGPHGAPGERGASEPALSATRTPGGPVRPPDGATAGRSPDATAGRSPDAAAGAAGAAGGPPDAGAAVDRRVAGADLDAAARGAAPGPAAGAEPAGDFIDHGALAGTVLDEQAAIRLFPNLLLDKGHRHRFDPLAVVTLIPDREVVYDWDEHPDGRIVARTNDRGFREDGPTPLRAAGRRVLVLGDSHTEGFVDNDESFANVLEARLRAGGAACELLNAGVGGTSPFSFAGMLRKHLDLRPDVVLAVVFTGNDVFGSLAVSDFFSKRVRGALPADYRARLLEARDRLDARPNRWGPAILGNGINQAYRFAHRPDEVELALAAVLEHLDALAALCRSEGIELAVVLLPTKVDVDLDDDRDALAEVLAVLGMGAEEARSNEALGGRIAAALAGRGIRCVDPTARLRGADEVLYWRKDYHLNVAGHARLAAILHDELGALLVGR